MKVFESYCDFKDCVKIVSLRGKRSCPPYRTYLLISTSFIIFPTPIVSSYTRWEWRSVS